MLHSEAKREASCISKIVISQATRIINNASLQENSVNNCKGNIRGKRLRKTGIVRVIKRPPPFLHILPPSTLESKGRMSPLCNDIEQASVTYEEECCSEADGSTESENDVDDNVSVSYWEDRDLDYEDEAYDNNLIEWHVEDTTVVPKD